MTVSTWEPPTTVPRPRPVRTTECGLWGPPAGQATTSTRFTWSQAQTHVFRCFIRDTYPNHKSCDLAPLLRALDLDGYNTIRNHHDESFYQLIVEKVRRKIGNTERAMRDSGGPLDSHARRVPMPWEGGSRESRKHKLTFARVKSEPDAAATPPAPAIDRAEPTSQERAPRDGLTSLSSIPRTSALAATAQMASRDRLYKEAKASSSGSRNRGTPTLFGASTGDASNPTTRQRSNNSVTHTEQHRAPTKQPLPLSSQYKFPGPIPSSSAPSFRFSGRTDVFAPFVFDPALLRQEPEPVSTTTKATRDEKPKATKKEKPKTPLADTTADESLRKRQLEREGLVDRMDETLSDFGEELLDAHQAPEETEEWYEEVDAMKQMYEFLQLRIRKLKKLEPLKE